MRLDFFNRWHSNKIKDILFENNEVKHLKVDNFVYILNKKDDEIYLFSDLKYYNKTKENIWNFAWEINNKSKQNKQGGTIWNI